MGHLARASAVTLSVSLFLAGCGGGGGSLGSAGSGGSGNIFGPRSPGAAESQRQQRVREEAQERETIWDLFRNAEDPNITLEVNKYIWNASLDILSFLPIEAADPFSGVIVTGFGTPPGGGRAYRATVLVRDPALDARSLEVSLSTRNGPASAETVRSVEDAILTRARQLRIQDANL